ncbi:MAG: DUF2721 domain-containing protein [Pseudomonadota bacterium]
MSILCKKNLRKRLRSGGKLRYSIDIFFTIRGRLFFMDINNTHMIGEVIQLAIAPIFLLVGTGSFLNVMSGRLGRVVDRVRTLEDMLEAGETGEERRRHVEELRFLSRRMSYANRAIVFCSASALFICLVVALLFLSEIVGGSLEIGVAALFILSVLCLILGLIQFLIEISVATKSLRVRNELLQHSD